MKKLHLFLLLILAQPAIYASTPNVSILCIEEESSGLNWKNGKWEKANFLNDKYLIKRLKLSETAGACTNHHEEPVFNGDYTDAFVSACYETKEFGTDSWIFKDKIVGRVCYETWTKNKESGNTTLELVECPGGYRAGFQITPNGNFIRGVTKASLHNEDEGKFSLSVSVGKCSTL